MYTRHVCECMYDRVSVCTGHVYECVHQGVCTRDGQ